MRSHTCCFTGHRQIPSEKRAEIAGRLEHVIVSLYQRGVLYYGAGGALGFDCLAAQTVLRLRESCFGMKLILVLPCLTQTRGGPLLMCWNMSASRLWRIRWSIPLRSTPTAVCTDAIAIWWTTAAYASAI